MAAASVLAVHLLVIGFNVAGLVVIPLGAWRGWGFVHRPLWRLAHLASLGAVAGQALAGRVCVLTAWQDRLAGRPGAPAPLIARAVDRLIFWNLPLWVFAALYVAVFVYVLALLWLVPLRRRRAG